MLREAVQRPEARQEANTHGSPQHRRCSVPKRRTGRSRQTILRKTGVKQKAALSAAS